MSAYYRKARASTEVFNGKSIQFDSQNEVQLAHWFEANGFNHANGMWERPVGTSNGTSRYTHDFELSVYDEISGQTKRAIVEAKPYKAALTPSIIRRMQGVAINFKTDLLLLFSRQENSWYRIDPVDGNITPTQPPLPGRVPLNKLPKAFSLTYEKQGDKYYARRFNPIGWFADVVIGLIQGPKPKKRRRK